MGDMKNMVNKTVVVLKESIKYESRISLLPDDVQILTSSG